MTEYLQMNKEAKLLDGHEVPNMQEFKSTILNDPPGHHHFFDNASIKQIKFPSWYQHQSSQFNQPSFL